MVERQDQKVNTGSFSGNNALTTQEKKKILQFFGIHALKIGYIQWLNTEI
jgi:hypothetical protein